MSQRRATLAWPSGAHVERASTKGYFFLAALATLAAGVGYLLFGLTGVILGAIIVIFLTTLGLQAPAAWVFRAQGGARVSAWDAPDLHRIVHRLAKRAQIPEPGLWLLPRNEANAMATEGGTGPGALAVTVGALRLLDHAELEGVLAHEVAHLKHGDAKLTRVVNAVSQTVVTVLRYSLWFAIFATLFFGTTSVSILQLLLLALSVPIAINLLTAALSRTRELAADATAARLTGRPLALASALARLERHTSIWLRVLVGGTPVPTIFRSHPSTRERVRRLRSMATATATATATQPAAVPVQVRAPRASARPPRPRRILLVG